MLTPHTESALVRFAILAAAALAGIVLAPAPARASDGVADLRCDQTTVGCQTPSWNATVTMGLRDDQAEDGALGPDGCRYRLTEPTADTADALTTGELAGVWYLRTCENGSEQRTTLVRLSAPPVPDSATIARHLRLSLRPPTPVPHSHTGPDPDGWPTWLWLAPASWQPVTATATSTLGERVSVIATPALAVWQTGDGSAAICAGPGTTWTENTEPERPSPDCGHLYTSAAPATGLRITVTVLWTLTAGSTTDDTTLPDLDGLTTTTTVDAGPWPSDSPDPYATQPS